MKRFLFLLLSPFLLLGNTISVLDGPRLIVPRSIEIGTPVTIDAGEEFLVADVFEVDRIRIEAPIDVQIAERSLTLPEGTVLSSFYGNAFDQSKRTDRVYCSALLADLLGGESQLPSELNPKNSITYRVCFLTDDARENIDRTFISNVKADFAELRNIAPVAFVDVTEPHATGDRIFWQFSKVRGGSNPKVKISISSYVGEQKFGGAGVFWAGKDRDGKTDWLTEIGSNDLKIPARLSDIMGLYDLSVIGADPKTKTMTIKVENVHDPVLFVREFGAPARTIYVYLP